MRSTFFFKSHYRESNIILTKGKRVRESRGMYQISFRMTSINKVVSTSPISAADARINQNEIFRVKTIRHES